MIVMPVLLNSTEWKLGLFLTLLVKTFLQIIYPFEYIDNALIPSIAAGNRNIFFLMDDAFGVPPTISRLSRSLGMCHFISGYTAKVAGAEADVSEPRLNFQLALERPFYLFTRLSMQHFLEGK